MDVTEKRSWLSTALVAIVLIHFVVLIWHGTVHMVLPVPLTGAQNAFVIGVIFLLPLAGAGLLLRTNFRLTAAWLVALSMLGSLLFGFINHFMRASPDNVLELPASAWRHSFVLSAAILVITETLGAVLGAAAVLIWRPTA
jgi:hypothetical protein